MQLPSSYLSTLCLTLTTLLFSIVNHKGIIVNRRELTLVRFSNNSEQDLPGFGARFLTFDFKLVGGQVTQRAVWAMMYLMMSVAGHLTIFLARTRGPFWSIRPANTLVAAVFGTQVVATLIAVYGLFMTPLGWSWAPAVWGYAVAWFLLSDRVKLGAHRLLEQTRPTAPLRATAG